MTRTKFWQSVWMTIAAIATVVVVWFLARTPGRVPPGPRDLSTVPQVAELVGPRLIAIAAGSAFEHKLEARSVESRKIALPVLTVTGSVAAHFSGGSGDPQDHWSFQSTEVSNAYADWRRAENEVDFATKQLDKTRELASAQVARSREVYERLSKLVEIGTEAKRDLASAKADLVQAELQTKKDVFEAESALNLGLRNHAAAERTLLQTGLDPAELDGHERVAIVVAEVPEAKLGAARQGEGCEARFYSIPDHVFPGRVASIAPMLSPERRTLRILFELPDSEDRLKPGMFADVGLGTDERDVLLIPTDAVLHAGRSDFVFARSEPGPWRVQEVAVGEERAAMVEVQRGLAAGEEVIGAGAILLKPILVRALEGERRP